MILVIIILIHIFIHSTIKFILPSNFYNLGQLPVRTQGFILPHKITNTDLYAVTASFTHECV